MHQYEYHVRFALSMAQPIFSCFMAIIIESSMFRYAFCSASPKQTDKTGEQGNVTSKPRKFADFRPRKTLNQLAKLHHNNNGPTWMKRKRVMGSGFYNPTNI
jgi:hypothetical protein